MYRVWVWGAFEATFETTFEATLHRLATDVPFIACVINLPCTFNCHLDMSSLQFCFMIWIVVF